MQTPEKRPLPSLSSPIKSPTKKDVVAGYLIDISAVSKGDHSPYYSIQFQTAEDTVVKMKGYNIGLHKTLLGYQSSGERVKIEVRRNENGITFGSYCNVLKASALEVPFELNTGLKQTIMARKITRQVTCAELKTIDPLTNREAFSLDVQVTFSLHGMHEVETGFNEGET